MAKQLMEGEAYLSLWALKVRPLSKGMVAGIGSGRLTH